MDVREKLTHILTSDPEMLENLNVSAIRLYRLVDKLISHGVTVQENAEISDELLKQLKNAPITILQEEPTIEVVREWISVKDRYPDEAGFYIGFFESRPGHWRVSTLHWNGTNWNNIGGYIPISVRTTHWMPLPQPPKGE